VKTIALIGALDTKESELQFVKSEIEGRGHRVLLIDTGVVGPSNVKADVEREAVAAAGGGSLADLLKERDRGLAIGVMSRGAGVHAEKLYKSGAIDGVIALGGSAGTAIGTAAMQRLPIGFPKVMVSTVASGDTRAYVGSSDIVMFPSVVDVAGLNRISRAIFSRAAGAVSGMVETTVHEERGGTLIGASMFGNTTKAVDRARASLENAGYEVLVFHATGVGGQTLERLVADEFIDAVLDLTTTEWADQLVGGVMAAGNERGDAASQRGVPQVIAPGCVDMVNFWARSTVPSKFNDRKFYEWNPNVTLMRTTPEENAQIGAILAGKANAANGPVTIMLPLKGLSELDAPGGLFWWPEANAALFDAIKKNLKSGIKVVELDCNINDPEFADMAAQTLQSMLGSQAGVAR
jgi:uncharacterized protein (UPF0261 family)